MKNKLLFLFLAWWLWPVIVWACPFCSEALFSPGQTAAQQGVWKGYLVSIAVLIGIPLALVGTVACVIVRAIRRSRRVTSRPVSPEVR